MGNTLPELVLSMCGFRFYLKLLLLMKYDIHAGGNDPFEHKKVLFHTRNY